jgi:hypothetical protein
VAPVLLERQDQGRLACDFAIDDDRGTRGSRCYGDF